MDKSVDFHVRDLLSDSVKRQSTLPAGLPLCANPSDVAESLLSRGQMSLLKGDLAQGLECFDAAAKLDSANAKLFHAQGLSLFQYGSEAGREKVLLLASKKFKAAVKLSPDYFDAWLAWGSTLCALGLTFDEHHYFQEAADKLRRAISLKETQPKESLGELYWDFGIVSSRLAEHSEEAMDLHQAIKAFEKATEYQSQFPSDFWKDYGLAHLKFASYVNEIRFYIKAIGCFKHAVSLEPAASETWSLLANSLKQLYTLTHDDDHFSQANECFDTATQLAPNHVHLWLNWAEFLIESTRQRPDDKRLRACIEKCQHASTIDSEQPLIQAIWAEALALLGNSSERVDLIYDAQNKICEAIDQDSNNPAIWYSYGMCLNVFGRYFNDSDLYYQAIEKFQLGLSLNRTYHPHWHAIGNNYALLGQMEANPEMLEQSLHFFERAINLNPSSFSIFDHAVALSKLGEMTHDKKHLDAAIVQFERALSMQRNAIYLHPNWLFHYGCTWDALGDFHEEEFYYLRAIEIFSHVLMIDPSFYEVHHRLGLSFSHLGELNSDIDRFFRAIHHYRLCLKRDEENDSIILDWALALINLAEHAYSSAEADQFYRDAEHKLLTAAKLGNLQSFYHLSCLYSLLGNHERAMHFLEKANTNHSLPPLEELLHDEWLESLRATSDFREFFSLLELRHNLGKQGEK
jgi:tetratricopeptide (TPR) repeat protein